VKVTKRQLRRVIKEFFGTREKSAIVAPAYKRAPELRAILDAAKMAHSSKDISYSQLKNFLFDLNATYATDRKIMEITRQQLRQVIVETLDLDLTVRPGDFVTHPTLGVGTVEVYDVDGFGRLDMKVALAKTGEVVDARNGETGGHPWKREEDDNDYYEERRREEVEELYLDDLQSLKAIVDSYGAVDIQRLMGDVKKERYLQHYNLNDIEDMLDELYNNDEIDYDEDSGQWVTL